MNFTEQTSVRPRFVRHSIIADHRDIESWDSPWLPSLRTIARAVICASFTARLRRCSPSRSIHPVEAIPNDPSSCWSNAASAAFPALVHAQPMRCMKSVFHPTPSNPRWCSTQKGQPRKLCFVGKSAKHAGRDVHSSMRNPFEHLLHAPTP